jgi:hypothetical protein
MTVRQLRQALLCSVAGAGWGALAYLLGATAFGPDIWGGVLASPLIGLGVGSAFQARFERSVGIRRAAVALTSLSAGSLLFGLAIGIGDLLVHGGRAPVEVVLDAVVAVLWGLTVAGFVLALGPLAYLTHAIIGWRLE